MRSPIVRIFVSSTFRDMAAERDLLATRIFPRLERRLEPFGWVLEVIDLRWGITASAVEDGLVPALCRRRIDEARPFFLGLLGARYGTRIRSQGSAEVHSITEDEILHGVFRSPKDLAGSAFLLRSSEDSAAVPPRYRHDYVDSDPFDVAAIDALRDRVIRSGVAHRTYRASWSDEHTRLEPGEDFERRAEELIFEQFRTSLQLPATAPSVDSVARAGIAQRVASTRTRRRAWRSRSEVERIDSLLEVARSRCLVLQGADIDLVHATALGVLDARRSRGECTVAVDGRYWTGEATAHGFLDFLRSELAQADALAGQAGPRRKRGTISGLRDALGSLARTIAHPTTLLVGFPEQFVPRGYWHGMEWTPALRRTNLRLLLYGVLERRPSDVTVAGLDAAGVRRALAHAAATDGRELDPAILKRSADIAALRTLRNVALCSEIFRSATSPDSLRSAADDAFGGLDRASAADGFRMLTRQLLRRLSRDLGTDAVAGTLPLLVATRSGVLDSDIEAASEPGSAWRAVAVARRLRRVLDVNEGRIRVTDPPRQVSTLDPDTDTRRLIIEAAQEVLGVTSLREIHAQVADRYGMIRGIAVADRDLVWHRLSSGSDAGIREAARLCMDPGHLARWTAVAPASEIDADMRAVSDDLADRTLASDAAAVDRWRGFVRSAAHHLRDPSLCPWQTALLAGMVGAGAAVRHARFPDLAVPRADAALLRHGCLGTFDHVTRVRAERGTSRLLGERHGLLEALDPRRGDVAIAHAKGWRDARPPVPARQGIAFDAGISGGFRVSVGHGEPVVRSSRGVRSIPQSTDSLFAIDATDWCAAHAEEGGLLTCWSLRDLAAKPPAHNMPLLEMRTMNGRFITWGFDGNRIEHDGDGVALDTRLVAEGPIWRVERAPGMTLLGGQFGVRRESDGATLTTGAVGDIALSPSGKFLAVAFESGRHELSIFALGGPDAPLGAPARVPLPARLRHGFRALHWLSDDALVVGMQEDGGPDGRIGCWNRTGRAWTWMDRLGDFGDDRQPMALDVHRAGEGLVVGALHLASTVVLIRGTDGARIGNLRIHDSGGMLHVVSLSADGRSLAALDRNGFCELWQLEPAPKLRIRMALPYGALMALCNTATDIAVATECGRVMQLSIEARAAPVGSRSGTT